MVPVMMPGALLVGDGPEIYGEGIFVGVADIKCFFKAFQQAGIDILCFRETVFDFRMVAVKGDKPVAHHIEKIESF